MLQLDRLLLAQDGFALRADWSAQAGERIALIGPSGAGKSTLLSAIAGFFAPKQGAITWERKNILALPAGERPLSILFQDQNLFPHLSIAQNVGLGLRPDLKLSKDQKLRIEETLEKLGLAGMGPRKPAQLSGGQASRVALARVMLRDRPLLLLDEPFSALGPAMKDEMLELLKSFTEAAGTLTLMVTHDPEDARHFADRISLVANGTAAPPQPTEEMLSNPPPALAAYLGQRK